MTCSAPIDLSYLADTVILLRYFEAFGRGAAGDLGGQAAHRRPRAQRPRAADRPRDPGRPPLKEFHGMLTGPARYTGEPAQLLPTMDDRS